MSIIVNWLIQNSRALVNTKKGLNESGSHLYTTPTHCRDYLHRTYVRFVEK